MSETRMENMIDLDALEAALGKAMPGTWHVGEGASGQEAADLYAVAAGMNALPALIAELRQLRARTTPEPIGEKHKDGNWWLCWEPGYKVWFKLRWRCEGWKLAACNFIGTPTHALPLPPAPEAQ